MYKTLWKYIEQVLDICLTLFVPLLMLAAAAAWSGELFGHEFGRMSGESSATVSKTPAPSAQVLQRMGLDGATLTVRDSVSWTVCCADTVCGRIVSSRRSAHGVTGYAGPVPVFVYIDKGDCIRSIVPDENAETTSFFTHAAEQTLPRWVGLRTDEAEQVKVDAVTGATYSSQALIANVRAALAADTAVGESAKLMNQNTPDGFWWKLAAVTLVMLLGLAVALRGKQGRALRLVVLIANVSVLGFWCGQFLSLTLLVGWASHGVQWLAYLPVVVILLISVLLPLFGMPHYYCNWVCPYGSLQEILWRLPVPKIQVSSRVWRRLKLMRRLLFGLLIFSLWTGVGSVLLDYEPFAAFGVTTASVAVLVLAGAFLLLGFFMPRPWCTCCCPLGELLSLLDRSKRGKTSTVRKVSR